MSLALEGRFLTPGPPEKSLVGVFRPFMFKVIIDSDEKTETVAFKKPVKCHTINKQ